MPLQREEKVVFLVLHVFLDVGDELVAQLGEPAAGRVGLLQFLENLLDLGVVGDLLVRDRITAR